MISHKQIEQAARAIAGHIHSTPLVYSGSLSRMTGAKVYLKCENFQKTGSFKVRGAFNKLIKLGCSDVIAASMGNHAQGVARAAADLGINATIVMPTTASIAKENAVRGYGAQVVLKGDSLSEALACALDKCNTSDAAFIHPYDDEDIIAGQGTVGLEITRQISHADCVVVPVGGGGLISGVALYIKHCWPNTEVLGVQAGAATSAMESFTKKTVIEREPGLTLADGIAVGRVGETTLGLMLKYVEAILAVGEASIARAVLLLMERKKMVVEGAGAVGLALLLEEPRRFKDKTVVLVVSGGNIDFTLVDRIIARGLRESGRTGALDVVIKDMPGALNHLTGIISALRGNILNVAHDRVSGGLPVQMTRVRVTLEVKDRAHLKSIIKATEAKGIDIKEVTDDYA